MENDLQEARVGRRFHFKDRPRPLWDGLCECEVVEAEPARRFVLRWGTNTRSPTRAAWTLTPTASGGTHVAFRHSELAGVMGWIMKKGMDHGWKMMLERAIPIVLADLGAGRTPSREDAKQAARQG